MRSMKYLPSVSSLNLIKYFRQLINNSIDVNLNLDSNKYVSNNNSKESKDDNNIVKTIDKSIDEKIIELSKNSNKNNLIENKSLIEDENKLFESALNEWIESKNQLNVNKSQTSDVLPSVARSQPSVADISDSKITVNTIVSKTNVELRTRQLLQSMSHSDTVINTKRRLQEFSKLLVSHPDAIGFAVKQKAVQKVLRLNHWSNNQIIRQHSSQVLSLLGYSGPSKGRGIRILSIDGGGTRGVIVIEILRQLERMSGKPIHQLFDLICGVSTGAIIGMLLGALQTPIDECEEYYHKFSQHLFQSDFFRGTGRLIWSHAYYDTNKWEKILKDIYSETYLMETKQSADTPNMLAISAVMNKPSLQAFLFRNYELPIHTRALSQYEGSSKYKIWEAVRASAAAPGYFEEFRKDQFVHQDGGILINNPTAVAIHEAKLLWPNEHIQCVLSLGSGRYIPPHSLRSDDSKVVSTSLKTKIVRLIDSATDTEMVHRLLKDLMPTNTYFRINPFLTEIGTLDENRPEKLQQMKIDAKLYLRKNDTTFKSVVKQLTEKRKITQKLDDWLRLQYTLRI